MISLAILLFIGYPRTTAPSGMNDKAKMEQFTQALNFLEWQRYDKEFELFIGKLGFDESHNNWKIINPIGAMGEWQFMQSTLHMLGYKDITTNKFRQDPNIFPAELQRKALEALIKSNVAIMQSYIDKYEGKIVGSIKITKAGIIAACHLGGPGGVKAFLNTHGETNNADMYGTSIAKYLHNYQHFDLTLNLIQYRT